MAKKRERVYTYYLEPAGDVARSNEVLGKNIEEEDAMQFVLCWDGKKRNLWRCPSGKVLALWSSRIGLKINFRVFIQEGKGQIEDKTRWYRRRHDKKTTKSYGRF